MKFNPRILLSILPAGSFYLFDRYFGTEVGIILSFVIFALVFQATRKAGVIGALAAVGFVVTAVSAGAGLLWESEKAYLASGPASDFTLVTIYAASVILGRPIIGMVAHEVFPKVTGGLQQGHGVFMTVTLLFAASELVQGIGRIWMIQEFSTGEYLLWSRVAGWPVTLAVVALSTALILYQTRREGEKAGRPLGPAVA